MTHLKFIVIFSTTFVRGQSPFSRDRERTFLCVWVNSSDRRSPTAQQSSSVESVLWAGEKEDSIFFHWTTW